MCGNTRAPSIVGRLAVINATPKIGSRFGPLKKGVTVRIDAKIEQDDKLRREYEENTGEAAPGQYYSTTMVSNPAGESLEGLPDFLVANVLLFRDEFDLAD